VLQGGEQGTIIFIEERRGKRVSNTRKKPHVKKEGPSFQAGNAGKTSPGGEKRGRSARQGKKKGGKELPIELGREKDKSCKRRKGLGTSDREKLSLKKEDGRKEKDGKKPHKKGEKKTRKMRLGRIERKKKNNPLRIGKKEGEGGRSDPGR